MNERRPPATPLRCSVPPTGPPAAPPPRRGEPERIAGRGSLERGRSGLRHSPSPAAPSPGVREQLGVLEKVFGRHGLDAALQQVRDKRRDLETAAELLVFVMGEGNFGKSSLINHLLGRRVAEVHFLPKTWRTDLYRRVETVDEQHALLRRAGEPAPRRMSLEEARAACAEQEARLRAQGQETQAAPGVAGPTGLPEEPPAAPADGIVEVQWHYAGLALPRSVVLVDTPGFSQFRTGLNRARAAVLASSDGIVFDLEEVYEQYYHRATLVLWAFRADRINDRDTVETFAHLSARGKQTLGVLTYVDQVPAAQRGELLQKAQGLYGRGVAGFVPVVTGGRSAEVGLGIEALRHRLAALEPAAAALQEEEAAQFCRFLARSGQRWLGAVGDTLIHNLSHISLYCNATSESLLRAAREQEAVVRAKSAELIGPQLKVAHFRDTPTGWQQTPHGWPVTFLDCWVTTTLGRLWKEGSGQSRDWLEGRFHAELAAHLQLETLQGSIRGALTRLGSYTVAEGARVAAGHPMRQLVLKAAGEWETRELDARIEPPDVAGLDFNLPAFHVGLETAGLFALALSHVPVVNWFVRPDAEVVDRVTRQTADEVCALRGRVDAAVADYTRGIAETVLRGAEEALCSLYPSLVGAAPEMALFRLQKYAEALDTDLARLHEAAGSRTEVAGFRAAASTPSGASGGPTGLPPTDLTGGPARALGGTASAGESALPAALDSARYRYRTLFRIWSPRDDLRLAAQELFSEWFQGQEAGLREAASRWLDPLPTASPLDRHALRRCAAGYLRRRRPARMQGEIPLDRFVDHPRRPHLRAVVQSWGDGLARRLETRRLFDDREFARELLGECEYLRLDGLAAAFSAVLGARFAAVFTARLAQATLPPPPVGASVTVPGAPAETGGLGSPRLRLAVATVGALAAGAAVPWLHAGAPTWQLGLEVAGAGSGGFGALAAGAALLSRSLQRRACFRYHVDALVAVVEARSGEWAEAAWREAVASLDGKDARRLFGQQTLARKRPLDQALEGVLELEP
ncbi:MAG TPA: dynamin family protein [Armatimonadota bacterium]|nr:dynamin family protein [Armatimonadota bacterium]